MSKNQVKKKKMGKLTLVLGISALVLLLVTGGMLIAAMGMDETDDPQINAVTDPAGESTAQEQTNTPGEEVPGTSGAEEETDAQEQQPEETKTGSSQQTESGKKDDSEKTPEETKGGSSAETQPPVEIVQRADAEYESWLAAAMLMGISMEYPDFELTGIYVASGTSLEDKMNSQGAYILFTSGGEAMAVHSVPTNGERSAAGTRDLSTETLGFATFDSVDPASVDTKSMKQLAVEDLSELIAQSLLVSVYIH